jgi:hypothetical protein
MKPASFEATPEFRNFDAFMRKIITVSKSELDAMVRAAKETSPRNGDRHAPGRKPLRPRRPKRK